MMRPSAARLALFAVTGMCAVAASCLFGCRQSERRGTLFVLPSSDGRLVAEADVNRRANDRKHYLCLKIEIRDTDGAVLLATQTGASSRMRWRLAWDAGNRLWLYSSDRGTCYWERQADGRWEERVVAQVTDPPAPPAEIRLELERAGRSGP
jgi:hypothetical protein